VKPDGEASHKDTGHNGNFKSLILYLPSVQRMPSDRKLRLGTTAIPKQPSSTSGAGTGAFNTHHPTTTTQQIATLYQFSLVPVSLLHILRSTSPQLASLPPPCFAVQTQSQPQVTRIAFSHNSHSQTTVLYWAGKDTLITTQLAPHCQGVLTKNTQRPSLRIALWHPGNQP
jgi:hypothetical protein